MNKFLLFLLMNLMAVLLAVPANVQATDDGRGTVKTVSNDISIRIGGTLQPRFTYTYDGGIDGAEDATERVGFGLRRLRVRLYTDIGDRLGVFLQMEGSGSSATWLDVRGEYRMNDHFTLRTGRFVGTQPRAYARTLHSCIDAIDRPAISDIWARMTIGADGRDYGVEAFWNSPNYEFRAFLHNGYNQSNFRSGISNFPATGGIDTDGFAFSASGTWWPSDRDELEIGAYAGINTAKNPLTQLSGIGRNYVNYSAQFYWGPLPGDQPFRVKADLIGISYQEVEIFGAENYIGGSLFGSVLVAPQVEVFAMGEYWYGDRGNRESFGQTFATAGATYSLSALQGRPFQNNRITLAYSLRAHESDLLNFDRDPAHVLMLQSQFYF